VQEKVADTANDREAPWKQKLLWTKAHTIECIGRCKKDQQRNHHQTATASPSDDTKCTLSSAYTTICCIETLIKPPNAVTKLAIILKPDKPAPVGTPWSWLEDQQHTVIIYEFLMLSWACNFQMTNQ
jgi:hypothetical protein